MSNRIVRFTKDIDLVAEGNCEGSWRVTTSENVNPLVSLANADCPDIDDVFFTHCPTHHIFFSAIGEGCPQNSGATDIKMKKGDQTDLPVAQAEWLIENDYAEYPTHSIVDEEAVTSTITRTNTLLDSMGLPNIDNESFRTINVEGKKGGRHYARPSHTNLARDLGLDPADIADMKKMGSTKP